MQGFKRLICLILAVSLVVFAPGAIADEAAKGPIEFNRDIRPIIADTCYACHGPDPKTRKAGLRFDIPDAALTALKSGHTAVVPGNRAGSALWQRITTDDTADRMPPASFEKELTPEQIELLGRWIDEGGQYEKHWAFVPPKARPVPAVDNIAWTRNPIDNFILRKLTAQNLSPSPEADKHTLIRRVTLDLTGLPPTPEEVRAYLDDDSPGAYENVVDRLLASPRYGEQLTRYWLDLARYADTNGYHIDNERYMWRWRDWVINAFNSNKPYDQFIVEQLAGDLLPEPTLEQRLATGFNRNHMINFEGGIIPEEYRVQYVADRVNTTGTVFLGLTVGCAQCHDHKYDPISEKEYYELYAFYNTIAENGSDGRDGNAVPFMKAPLPGQEEKIVEVQQDIERLVAEMSQPDAGLDAAQAVWEGDWADKLAANWTVLTPESVVSTGGATLTPLEDGSLLASGENPEHDTYELVAETEASGITAIRLEALGHEAFFGGSPARSDNGNFVLTEFEVEIGPVDDPGSAQRVPIAAVNADHAQKDFEAARAIDGNPATGWASEGFDHPGNRVAVFSLARPTPSLNGSHIRIRLKHESEFAQHNIGRFRLSISTDPSLAPVELGPWYINGPFIAEDGNTAYTHDYGPEQGVDLAAKYDDGRLKWAPKTDLPDGALNDLYGDIAATYLYRAIKSPTDRNVTLKFGSNDALKVWLNGEIVVDKNVQRPIEKDQETVDLALREGDNELLAKVVNYGSAYAFYFNKGEEKLGEFPLDIELMLAKAPESRSDAEQARLREFYRRVNWPEWPKLNEQLLAKREELTAAEKAIPTAMVMEEMAEPRETFILERGQYDQFGEKVTPAVPAALPPLPEGAPANRLGLAQWIVDDANPLTARVAVNRFWQRYFGTGIVKTTSDFGSQGEWPTHPELLDWLAMEFVRSGWNVKDMQRLIVTSAAYRQSSRVRPEVRAIDPENRLITQGPRFRMDAEMVRDSALAVSGLLVEHVGGPSVKPYQPKGLWEEVAYGAEFTAQRFEADQGDALYRRSMYTFWKRQSPPPSMMLFDAPNRETCTALRARTNTPLQALALMNDPQFVEASRKLAERVMTECTGDPGACIEQAFLLATARLPGADEKEILLGLYNEQLTRYQTDPDAAEGFVSVGDSPRRDGIDTAALAAMTMVANTILNLDETVTKS